MPLRNCLLVAIAALAIGACVSGAPTPSAGNPSPVPTPTSTPSPSATASGSGGLALLHADPQLEAKLPGTVNGATILKVSFRGDDFLAVGGSGANVQEFREMIERLGGSADRFSVAVGANPSNAAAYQMGVFQLSGVDGARLLQELVTVSRQESNSRVAEASVGGKSVTTITNTRAADSPTLYAYAKGADVFFVTTKDPAAADVVVAAMP